MPLNGDFGGELAAQTLNFPADVTAGLDFQAGIVAPDYPAPAWTVEAVMRGPGQIDLVAAGSSGTHTFSADATATAEWVPGLYVVSIRAANGASKVEVARTQITVNADLASVATPYDGRSDNEKALAAIEAVIAGRATIDQDRYRINNRELWRTPITELLRLQSFYKTRVRRERLKAKGASTLGRNIPVRFS